MAGSACCCKSICPVHSTSRTGSSLKPDEHVSLLRSMLDQTSPSQPQEARTRPCFFLLQILGMWKPRNGRFDAIWAVYSAFVRLLWLTSLVAIMCLDFVHYGFKDRKRVHLAEIMNSVPTCLNLLCPFVFTQYYFKRGQFNELMLSRRNLSVSYGARLAKVALFYTGLSIALWVLGATFFVFHWTPFFSVDWHYAVYIPVIVYTTGWWAVWLSIYGFVCQIHGLQIDHVVGNIKSVDCRAALVLYKHQQLQSSLEKTQKDFNIIISFALAYHTADIIIFSFAYFDLAFGSHYTLWQYVGGVLFDLISILIKLGPPALVASAIHQMVTQAAKRCETNLTPLATSLPLENMQLFQHIACCEPHMGLKILGIRITVEFVGKILMTILTAAVSFVAFVVPRLK